MHVFSVDIATAYLFLPLPLSGDGVILDLALGVHLHGEGVGRLVLPAHLQGELGHVDLRVSTSISEILRTQHKMADRQDDT